MLLGLLRKAEPLKGALDAEREILLTELIDEALDEEEIVSGIASHDDLSADGLRASALAASKELFQTAASEEESLRDQLRNRLPYNYVHWEGPQWLEDIATGFAFYTSIILLIASDAAVWLLVRDWTGSIWWAVVVTAVIAIPFWL